MRLDEGGSLGHAVVGGELDADVGVGVLEWGSGADDDRLRENMMRAREQFDGVQQETCGNREDSALEVDREW